jgi:hypothetical protein
LQVLYRGAQADACGAAQVLGRGAQAVARGAARCATQVLDNARVYTFARSTSFCASWVCINSNLKSLSRRRPAAALLG